MFPNGSKNPPSLAKLVQESLTHELAKEELSYNPLHYIHKTKLPSVAKGKTSMANNEEPKDEGYLGGCKTKKIEEKKEIHHDCQKSELFYKCLEKGHKVFQC